MNGNFNIFINFKLEILNLKPFYYTFFSFLCNYLFFYFWHLKIIGKIEIV
jgi:hypothetical protein